MSEKLFVLGHPVAHSKSPVMYNAAYQALGLDWHYDFMDCATELEASSFLASRDWLSINITTPYKPLAFSRASRSSTTAQLAHGANVLVNVRNAEGGSAELLADNTDGVGCVSYLRRCGVKFPGACVVICGTGPAARAIMHAIAQAGASRILLFGRALGRTEEVVQRYRADLQRLVRKADSGVFDDARAALHPQHILEQCAFEAHDYSELPALLPDASVVVDATTLGMNPGDPAPFPPTLLDAHQTVFDVVYGHGETALVAGARARGCATYNGEGMLVAQAVETVRDIAQIVGGIDFEKIDLFTVMARAAGFKTLS